MTVCVVKISEEGKFQNFNHYKRVSEKAEEAGYFNSNSHFSVDEKRHFSLFPFFPKSFLE